jgi:hypothetical protein
LSQRPLGAADPRACAPDSTILLSGAGVVEWWSDGPEEDEDEKEEEDDRDLDEDDLKSWKASVRRLGQIFVRRGDRLGIQEAPSIKTQLIDDIKTLSISHQRCPLCLSD